jgi:hypothetical protein
LARTVDDHVRYVHDLVGATIPLAEATLATVEQVQEGVIEMSYSPVPPCPDHQHPLKAVLEAGALSWVCPVDAAHYSEPILFD